MYNQISEQSFRVKSFSIIYQDLKNPKKTIEGNCFFIEPNKEMAFRNDGELIEAFGIKNTEVTTESFHHLILFNYMIGNTDWNIATQKNLKFFRKKGMDKFTVVPYDFDNCKLVDPPYMTNYPGAKREKRDNRYVLEKFHSQDELLLELMFFQKLKDDYFAICDDCEKLKTPYKKRMKNFLKPFFKSLPKTKKMEKLFLE